MCLFQVRVRHSVADCGHMCGGLCPHVATCGHTSLLTTGRMEEQPVRLCKHGCGRVANHGAQCWSCVTKAKIEKLASEAHVWHFATIAVVMAVASCPSLTDRRASRSCVPCLPGRANTGGSSGRTPVPPEELAPAHAGGGGGGGGDAAAAAVSQRGPADAPITLADVEEAAAKGIAAALQAAGMGPADPGGRPSLPSEKGALQQNAQIMQSLLLLVPSLRSARSLRIIAPFPIPGSAKKPQSTPEETDAGRLTSNGAGSMTPAGLGSPRTRLSMPLCAVHFSRLCWQ